MVKLGDYESREVWMHNSLLGKIKMAISSMEHILHSGTTTEVQKQQAIDIQNLLFSLYGNLKVNRIPPYSTSSRAIKRRKLDKNPID
jgi:hypothetical protein